MSKHLFLEDPLRCHKCGGEGEPFMTLRNDPIVMFECRTCGTTYGVRERDLCCTRDAITQAERS